MMTFLENVSLNLTVKDAIQRQDVGALKRFLEEGLTLNETDGSGWNLTPLMWAAHGGARPCLEFILRSGAHVNTQDDGGQSAAMHAALQGHAECLGLLLKAGADIEAKDEGGWTLAMYAAEGGDPECLALVIAAGSDLSVQSSSSLTALSLAEEKGHRACVDMIRSEQESRCLKEALAPRGFCEDARPRSFRL